MAYKSGKSKGVEWLDEINLGLEWRAKTSREDTWPRIHSYYEHKFEEELNPNFNLIYMFASSIIPAVVYQRPHIINTPRRPEFGFWAQFFDGIDNWLADEMEIQAVCENAILDAFLYNMAPIGLGYDHGTEYQSELVFESVEGTLNRTRKTNQPWVDNIRPKKIVFAPGTRSMHDCRWFAKNFDLKLEAARKLFPGSKITATHTPDKAILSGSGESEIKRDMYVSIWEIHDAETGNVCFIDSKGGKIDGPREDELQVDGLPIEVLTFNKGSESIWGTPDSLYIETQLLEGNECRLDARLQRKIALVKFLYKADLMSNNDFTKLLTGDPGIGIPIDVGGTEKLEDVISVLQPHVQMELFEYQKNLLNDAQLLTGTGPNQFGTFASGRRTKYETQVVEERNLLRTGYRRERLGKIIGSLFSKINQLVVKNWKAPIVAKVVGVEGAIHWVKARPAEFKEVAAQLTTKVNVESMTPVSRERKRGEMIEILGVLAKFQENVNIMPILQGFLSTFEWSDVMNSLPQANQGNNAASVGEFQSQQNAQLKNPQLGENAANNLGGLNRKIGAMPSESTGAPEESGGY